MSQPIYEKIGSVALNAKRPMTIEELAVEIGVPKNGRNIHNYVRGAYNYFLKQNKPEISGKIAGAFTDNNGEYIYQK